MHIRRNRPGWKTVINLFGTELNAHLGTPCKIDRPLVLLGFEIGFLQGTDGTFHVLGGHNKIHILRDHRFGSPMIYGDATDGAPWDVRTLKTGNKPHDIVCAS